MPQNFSRIKNILHPRCDGSFCLHVQVAKNESILQEYRSQAWSSENEGGNGAMLRDLLSPWSTSDQTLTYSSRCTTEDTCCVSNCSDALPKSGGDHSILEKWLLRALRGAARERFHD